MLCQEEGQGAKSKTQGPKRGRENFVSAAIGDEVLVWGGIKASQQMVDSAVWSFNVRTCKWRMLHNGKGTRPEPTELAASFVIQDTLYIHGGQNTYNCAQVETNPPKRYGISIINEEGGECGLHGGHQAQNGDTLHAHTHTDKHTHTHIHTCMHAHIRTRMHACMHTCTHACMYARMHACMYARRHACMYARRHANMHTQGQFWAWKHGEQRWQQLPTHGDHPHSLTEAVGTTLPAVGDGGTGGKTLGVVFGGFFNSGHGGGFVETPQEISLVSEEDVLVFFCVYVCVHACE